MSQIKFSVALRAKARMQSLHAWSNRVVSACNEGILSLAQHDRAIDWIKVQIIKATRQLCAFSSKAAVQTMFNRTLGRTSIYVSVDDARETLQDFINGDLTRTDDEIVEPIAYAAYYLGSRIIL